MNSNPYASPYTVAAQPVDVRATFIRKTYAHLAGAIMSFIVLEYALLKIEALQPLTNYMMGSWWLVIILFMGASFMAQKMAHSASKGVQYAGLAFYVTAWAFVFLPVMGFATAFYPEIVAQGAAITLALFAGITAIAFITKKDFSFLNSFLMIGSFVALGLIAASYFIGFDLGVIFCAAMAIFASVAVLRDTSNVIHHYGSEQYVGASLGLFSSVALLFWYIIQILLSFASSD